MSKVLILGSKEYPFGINDSDPILSGGIEVHVDELIKVLRRKHEVTVITRRFSDRNNFEKLRNVTIHRVPWIKGFFFRNPSFNFMSFFKALRLDFDVIISNDVAASVLAVFLSKVKRKPLIVVHHGSPASQKQYNFLIRKAFGLGEFLIGRSASHIITVKDRKFKVPSTFIGQGFDKSWFDLKKVKPKKTVFLSAGRLVGVKSLHTIIEALQGFKDYELVIMGDGPERQRLEALSKDLGVKARFTGAYKRDDFKRALSKASFYVLPSQSEGVPYSLLEAMSSRTPVIVSDIGLLDESKAWIFPQGDSKALAQVINNALSSPGESLVKSSNAFRKLDDYSWESVGGKYDSVIRSVIL